MTIITCVWNDDEFLQYTLPQNTYAHSSKLKSSVILCRHGYFKRSASNKLS